MQAALSAHHLAARLAPLLACVPARSTALVAPPQRLAHPPPPPPRAAAGDAWLWSRDGSAYHAAAAHFAHLLAERCWGLTPAGFTAYGSGGLAPMKAVAQRAPEAGGGWGDAGLQRQGSFSSVGQLAHSYCAHHADA